MNEGNTATQIPTSFGDPGAAPPPTPPAFLDLVPQEYREREYIAEIAKSEKPFENLLKQFENQQTLIGKKSVGIEVPGDDATPEAVKAFHKALGVPDNADGYEYKALDLSKEDETVQKYAGELAKDDSFMKLMKAKAHEVGVTPKQFAALASAMDTVTLNNAKAAVEAAKTQGESQREAFKKLYGDNATEVERIAKEVAAKVLPENVRATGDPNLALFEAMRYIHEKVFKNDSIGGANQGAAPQSKEDLRKEIDSLRQNPAFKNQFARGHDDVVAKVNELYTQMLAKPEA